MTEKASGLGGNVAWVAGIVVAMGVSVYALVASGVLDGSAVEDTSEAITQSAPAPETTAETTAVTVAQTPAEDVTASEAVETENPASAASTATTDAQDGAEAVTAPSFDLVRVDAEGNTVIAGAAAPNAILAILLDGVEIATSPADNTGQFAAILSIAPSEAPRVLSLIERRDAGDVPSDATVIVAPVLSVAAPVATNTEQTAAASEDVASIAAEDASAPDAAEDIAEDTAKDTVETAAADTAAPAAKAPAVIVSDSDGVRVLQPATAADTAPEVLAAVSIDSISYTDTGAVMVSGRGAKGRVVRLYLNNDLAAEAAIDDTGMWTSQLSDVAGGLYEMRADEVDDSGKVTSRILTPFKRETPETVARARAQADATAADQPTIASQGASEGSAPAAEATPETTAEASAEAQQPTPPAPPAGDEAVETPAEEGADTASTTAPVETALADTADTQSSAPTSAATETAATESVTTETESVPPAVAAENTAQPAQPTAEDTTALASATEDAPVAQSADTADSTPAVAAPAQPDVAVSEDVAQPAVQIVTVQPGSTLWAIARDNYGEGLLYLRVFEANKEKILNPDLIYPGQVFTVPEQ
ncbi:LysM peptidoglycan-binding domain-containing protein [Shimia sp. R10_1]|uniref:LysM peptidoglycan-binding domain-containing protein n=1 Tax=Shimia sp. R10_1 TaxID=2821095 RepID=UPI001ADB3BC8|nr:LysM peptidoglycan-binding domain-containing protein [Shimia sp. R10_1]MBO9471933.1 LysM peptidoglycan-binding domain-containing protein [Shimia sp. R10_1]